MACPTHTTLIGVPSAAGACGPGVESAFDTLREARLVESLRAIDAHLEDRGHLSLFPFRKDPENPNARNVSGVTCAAEAVLEEMLACGPQARTLVVGGGCAILVGVVAAVARLRGEAPGVVFLDAHADLNTPQTSPSGFLDGMALALALGRGPSRLATLAGSVGWPAAERVALLGYREVDPGEQSAVANLGLALTASDVREHETADTVARALSVASGTNRPVVVHVDLDVLDPEEVTPKVGGPAGPGVSAETLVGTLGALWAEPCVVALLVTGFDPATDPSGHAAVRIVTLLADTLSRAR